MQNKKSTIITIVIVLVLAAIAALRTTGADGKITLTNILAGNYTVEEIDVPGRYSTPANNPRTVTVNWKATATFF